MTVYPLLSGMVLFPLIAAFFISLIVGDVGVKTRNARNVVVFTNVVMVVLFFIIAMVFDGGIEGFQLEEKWEWFFLKGSFFRLGVDSFSFLLLFLSTILFFIASLMKVDMRGNPKGYMVSFCLLQAGINGALVSIDIAVFYVFSEMIALPVFFLIGHFGSGKNRIFAAFRFLFYSMASSAIMLLAVMLVYGKAQGFDTMDLSSMKKDWKILVWALMMLSLTIKIPLIPLHNWLSDAHTSAPNPVSVILSGLVLKLGVYSMLRLPIGAFPDISKEFSGIFLVLGVINIFYGGFVTVIQRDMKRMAVYSALVQMGLIIVGVFSFTQAGMQGALLAMFAHGLLAAGLFLGVDVMQQRRINTHMKGGGLIARMPLFAGAFMLISLSAIGIPGTIGFAGELLIFTGVFMHSFVLALLSLSVMLFSCIYIGNLYRRVFLGPQPPSLQKQEVTDLSLCEKMLFLMLVAAIFVFGLFPGILSDTAASYAFLMAGVGTL